MASSGEPQNGTDPNQGQELHRQTLKSMQQLSQTLQTLHNKVDKLVRQVDDVVDQQKKMHKALQSLIKQKTAPQEAQSQPPLSVLALAEAPPPPPPEQAAAPTPSGFNHWAKNLFLVGDEQWRCLQEVKDIARDVAEWKNKYGLIVRWKPGETLSNLYDAKRHRLLVAIPPGASKVAISVGAEDLNDARLLTLDIASLEEVRKQNDSILKEKANIMKGMVNCLLELNITVVFVLPPQREKRTEVLQHWEEIVMSELAPLKSSQFKIVNLPKEMRASMASFESPEEFTSTWFSKNNRSSSQDHLSPYGASKLIELLRGALMNKLSEDGISPCFRCTRAHPGGEEACKSRDKMCRRCERVGHFQDIHNIVDRTFQDQILRTLGGEIEFQGEIRRLIEQPKPPVPEENQMKRKRTGSSDASGGNPNMEPLGSKRAITELPLRRY